jgi:FlaG/FlaF family flagellin (archaellin)
MKKLSIALVVALLCGAVAMASTAGARGKASTTVTIKYNGDGFQGKVKSSAAKCVKDRTVTVYKQKGSSQDRSTDQKLFSDTTDSGGSWDTGNSGQAHGKFYAFAKGTTSCKKGSSKTIKV